MVANGTARVAAGVAAGVGSAEAREAVAASAIPMPATRMNPARTKAASGRRRTKVMTAA